MMKEIEKLKQLREETGISFAECRKALEEAEGDLARAKELLRKHGQRLAEMRTTKGARQGIIEAYVHTNKKIGVLLDIRCESDFVARSPDFQRLAHEIVLQIAAMNPLYVASSDIPEEFLVRERTAYEEQLANSGKSREIREQIVAGKLKKYQEEISLLSQIWIKDDTKTVQDLIDEYVARLGENIVVKRFARYEI